MAPGAQRCTGGRIASVAPSSPADDAGFYPGCSIETVDGEAVHDIIDWRWLSADDRIELGYCDADGGRGSTVLVRSPGEDWGIGFEGAIFDGIRECRNACSFCFMRQLPENSRPSLSVRDDDFRLSFLQGTFVTLTNLGKADEERIVGQRISPLRMSLHAITPAVRSRLIGRHAAHGIAACERLMAAGIEIHAQIVLIPGANDGEELLRTLAWAYRHPAIRSVGIVPLGYTKHQGTFSASFNAPAAAQRVLADIAPVQERALAERGVAWVYAADEFYRNAYPDSLLGHLPPASHYGAFDMFEDGIGIIRSFVDDWHRSLGAAGRLARALDGAGRRVHLVAGYAQREFLLPLLDVSPLAGRLVPLFVKNDYFGGNVDVTGLLVGADIVRAIRRVPGISCAAVPRIVFNADGVTLDDMRLEDMQSALDVELHVVSCNASEYFCELADLVRKR